MTAPDTTTIPLPKPPSISIRGSDGSELLRIDPDGTVAAADLILAQEAGRIFVDAVRQHLKPMADLVAEVQALKAENERLKTDLEDARRIAARVLDEDAENRLAEEMARVIWGGHEPSGWKSFIGEARIALAYLKGETL